MFLMNSGEHADPAIYTDLAAATEANGWDGLYLWDHVLRPETEPQDISDPWTCLAVAAVATERIRLGTMITPATRRRPIKLARETLSIDLLSKGRMTLGLGLGVDTSGELSKFDDIVDPKVRGQRLDEAVEILCGLWSGQPFDFEGEHFAARDVTMLPPAVQQPRIPMWFAARGEARKPVRRAARYDGLFPVDVDGESLRAMVELIAEERGGLDGFDIACRPGGGLGYREAEEIGATWALTGVAPGTSLRDLMALAEGGPERAFDL